MTSELESLENGLALHVYLMLDASRKDRFRL